MHDDTITARGPVLDGFIERVPFVLDEFQLRACRAVENGRSVLVCAPTGSGKTMVGEFGIECALAEGTTCFYTTPIKALSNQKFHELVAIYGEDSVGLLTGDVSINPRAQIVVMTTEILRNMLYADSESIDSLSHVILDEIHFLADRSRGAVWEEVILTLPGDVRIIGLSATVSNAEKFGEWLRTVRGDTEVVVSEDRPVPLLQWMLIGRDMMPLLKKRRPCQAQGSDEGDDVDGPNDRDICDDAQLNPAVWRAIEHSRPSGGRIRPTSRASVLRILNDRAMLPAIVFIFSRAGCDGALMQCANSRLALTTQDEARIIGEEIDRGVEGISKEDLDALGFKKWRSIVQRGCAAHHAGMLPAFRHIVEKLFERGLIKAVFATETLAVGINMPARTVVLEKLVKFNGESHVDLTPGQFTQLTGRAGRRGIDIKGNAVVQWRPDMDPEAVAQLASTRTYPLDSTFTPGYNMSVNAIRSFGYDETVKLIGESFAQFQADRSIVSEVRSLNRTRDALAGAQRQLAEVLEGNEAVKEPLSTDELVARLTEYSTLRARLSTVEKEAKRRSGVQNRKEILGVLRSAQRGDVLAVPTDGRAELVLVLEEAIAYARPALTVITEHNWVGRMSLRDCATQPINVGTLRLPRTVGKRGSVVNRKERSRFASMLRHGGFKRPNRAHRRPRDASEIKRIKKQLAAHPVHMWQNREQLLAAAADVSHHARKVAKLERRISARTGTLAETFRNITELLEELGYVSRDADAAQPGEALQSAGAALTSSTSQPPSESTWVVTEEGEYLARIHHEADLLVAQCLRRGIWGELDPAELAAMVSCVAVDSRVRGVAQLFPTEPLRAAWDSTLRIWEELAADEERHHLPVTPSPNAALMLIVHQWAAGAPFEYVLAASDHYGMELTAGDFVRAIRRTADALEQIRNCGFSEEIRDCAKRAIPALRRGLVAIGN